MKNNKPYLYQRQRKDMTLIIGAKCKDGVVLIADRRIVEGTDITSGDKITFLPLGIIVAGAGVGEVIDKFNERIPFVFDERKRLNFEEMRKENPKIDFEDVPFYFRPYEFLEDCEGLILQLTERYKRPLQILVASGNIPSAELNYIDSEGFLTSKRRTYISIGSGSPYANFILKKIWNKDLTMDKMAKIGKLIIEIVAESKIDTFVGDGTQIVFVPDKPEDFDSRTEQEKITLMPHQKDLTDFDEVSLRAEFNKSLSELFDKISKG
jgi:20S proteasome alpha/beta subunit